MIELDIVTYEILERQIDQFQKFYKFFNFILPGYMINIQFFKERMVYSGKFIYFT